MRRTALVFLAAAACGPRIDAVEPSPAPGGRPVELTIRGARFGDSSSVAIGGRPVRVLDWTESTIVVAMRASKRGSYDVEVTNGARETATAKLEVANTAPTLAVASPHLIRIGGTLRVPVAIDDFDGDVVRRSATGTLDAEVRGGELVVATASAGVHTLRVTADDGIRKTTTDVRVEVRAELPAPRVVFSEGPVTGSRRASVTVHGENLTAETSFVYDGVPVRGRTVTRDRAVVEIPPRPRGRYPLATRRDGEAITVEVGNSTPVVEAVSIAIDERQPVRIPVRASDPDGDELVHLAIDLWPGARFDPSSDEVVFEPDFIQGKKTYRGVLVARDRTATGTAAVTVKVRDTIQPPLPKVLDVTQGDDHQLVAVRQETDRFLDPNDRDYQATFVVPREGDRLPLRVYLHPFGGRPYRGSGRGDQFCLYPHDPDDTYWYGLEDQRGVPRPYTVRRVLHLVEWMLITQPRIDPDRVYVYGVSMGGAGAITIGAKHARHFAFAEGELGQLVPRRHRPTRRKQLSTLWGPPSKFWDAVDVPRLLVESPEAQNQFYFTRHSKDDPIIHFGAVLFTSPIVDLGWYDALQQERVGHYAVWDEGGHGSPDPELGKDWWVDDWDRALDASMLLRRDRAFVAFTRSSLDDDPGSAKGDGTRPFDEDRGFGGSEEVTGDQGWGGDRFGALNRHLRWFNVTMVDELDRFEIGLRSLKPATVDVTPRRTRRFVLRPGDPVRYAFGAQTGTVRADERGRVTVRLEIGTRLEPLVLVRDRATTPRDR